MSATGSIEEQVEAVFERVRERNLSKYVGLTLSNRAKLDGDFSVAELEEILSQLRRFDTKEWMTAGYLEKDFSLSSGGEDIVYVGSRPCSVVIDAEGEEVAYAPFRTQESSSSRSTTTARIRTSSASTYPNFQERRRAKSLILGTYHDFQPFSSISLTHLSAFQDESLKILVR